MKYFYPGSGLWKKRLAKMAILFMIGANLSLNGLQGHLFERGEDMMEMAEDLSQPMADAATVIEQDVLPFLDYAQSSALGQKATSYFSLPDTRVLHEGIGQVHGFRQMLSRYAPYFSLTANVVRLTSFLFWMPIGLSFLWLALDLFYCKNRNARLFVLTGLALAIPFNILVYRHLDILFTMPESAIFDSALQILN